MYSVYVVSLSQLPLDYCAITRNATTHLLPDLLLLLRPREGDLLLGGLRRLGDGDLRPPPNLGSAIILLDLVRQIVAESFNNSINVNSCWTRTCAWAGSSLLRAGDCAPWTSAGPGT